MHGTFRSGMCVAVAALVLFAGATPAAADAWQEVYRSPYEVAGFGGIDVRTSRDVWLAGGRLSPAGHTTFSVRFDGAAWHLVSTGDPRDEEWVLYDIEAIGSSTVWAVGVSDAAALTLRWDGVRWRRVRTPWNAAQLWAIDRIPGTRTLLAVGSDRQGRSLVLKWAAGRWREKHLGPWVRGGVLYGVDVVSRRLAWAVGDGGLILRLTPKGWTRIEDRDLHGIQLWDVAALRADRAFAIGSLTRLLRWNGRNWRTVPRFWAGANLQAVVAGEGAVWATGARPGATSAELRPFAMRWQGGRWEIVSVRDIANDFNEVAVGGGCVWTAGSLGEGESNTAVFRRCG